MLQIRQWEKAPHRRGRVRTCWAKSCLLERGNVSYMPLLMDIRENNPEDYRNFLHMDKLSFQESLLLVKPYIQRQNTKLQRARLQRAEDRLVATLRYLATRRSLEDLTFGTRILAQALGHIITETCKAIVKVLKFH